MGAGAKAPPLPALEILDVPEAEIDVTFIQRESITCRRSRGNRYSHFGFLHAGHVDADDVPETIRSTTPSPTAPRNTCLRCRLGHAIRGLPRRRPGPQVLALRQLPVSVLEPGAQRRIRQSVHAAPGCRSTTLTMFCFLRWKRGASAHTQPARLQGRHADRWHRARQQVPAQPTDWLGLAARIEPWQRLGDRPRAQRSNAIYSGIDGIHLQDQAITESMGPIHRHTWEHLAPSDQMITRTRRRLLMAAAPCATSASRRPARRTPSVPRCAQRYLVSDDQGSWQESLWPATGRGGAPAAGPVARGGVGGTTHRGE